MSGLDDFERTMDRRFHFLARLLLKCEPDPTPVGIFSSREAGILLALGFTRYQGGDHPNRMASDRHCLAIDKETSGGWRVVYQYDDTDLRKTSLDFIAILMYLADEGIV